MKKPRKPTAVKKADNSYSYWTKKVAADKKKYDHSKAKYDSYYLDSTHASNNHWKVHYQKLYKKWEPTMKADKVRLSRSKKKQKAAKSKKARISKEYNTQMALYNKVADINEHNKSSENEGKCAIYPSDGSGGTIYIAPSDSESEDMTANITSYPVDEGAPSADYARISGKTMTIAGLITGDTRAEANQKYATLKGWMNHHKLMTYRGDFCYKHLQFNDIQQSFSGLKDNLKVSIGFTFVYPVRVTKKATGKHNKKKSSKSSKTMRGNRKKTYKAITVKKGMTVLGLSHRYGKSVAWIEKVNHLKNGKLYSGHQLYVAQRSKKKGHRAKVRAK